MTRGNTKRTQRRSVLLWVAAASVALAAPLATWEPAYAGTADWPSPSGTASDERNDPWDEENSYEETDSWDSRGYEGSRNREDVDGYRDSGIRDDSWDRVDGRDLENSWDLENAWDREDLADRRAMPGVNREAGTAPQGYREPGYAEPAETLAEHDALEPANRIEEGERHEAEEVQLQGAEPRQAERNLNNAQATNNYVSVFIPSYGSFIAGRHGPAHLDDLNEDGRPAGVSYRGESPNLHFFLPATAGKVQQSACAVAGGNALPGSCPSFVSSASPLGD